MSQERFEQRRRAARWRRIRRYLLVVLALAALGGAIWLIWFSTVLTVTKVDVTGMTTLKAKDIRETAEVPMGLQLARVDPDPIETRVATMERIDTIDVARRWPNTIRITVKERFPIAWVRSNGLIRQVDRHGVDFRTLDDEPDELVEIRIHTDDPLERQQSLEAVAGVIAFLRADGRDVLTAVQHMSASTQDSVRLTLGENRTVVWGSAEHNAKKLAVLRVLLHKVKASRYDVSAPELPTTKK